MSEEDIRKAISKTAEHLLDNYDELIKPDIPIIAKDIQDIVKMCKSGKYTQEEIDKIVKAKARKFGGSKDDRCNE